MNAPNYEGPIEELDRPIEVGAYTKPRPCPQCGTARVETTCMGWHVDCDCPETGEPRRMGTSLYSRLDAIGSWEWQLDQEIEVLELFAKLQLIVRRQARLFLGVSW